jgi:hypothetical protein
MAPFDDGNTATKTKQPETPTLRAPTNTAGRMYKRRRLSGQSSQTTMSCPLPFIEAWIDDCAVGCHAPEEPLITMIRCSSGDENAFQQQLLKTTPSRQKRPRDDGGDDVAHDFDPAPRAAAMPALGKAAFSLPLLPLTPKVKQLTVQCLAQIAFPPHSLLAPSDSASMSSSRSGSTTTTTSGRSSPRKKERILRHTRDFPVDRRAVAEMQTATSISQETRDLVYDLHQIGSGEEAVIPDVFQVFVVRPFL